MIVNPANVVLTAQVAHWADEHPARTAWILHCLQRHNTADWGDLDDDDDTAANNHALHHHDRRVLSRYPIPAELLDPTVSDDALWVITDDLDDPDGLTTILWPSDY